MEWLRDVLIAILVLIISPYLLRKWRKILHFKTLMNTFPGPEPHFILGSASEYNVPREGLAAVFEMRFKKYGPLVRVWNLNWIEGDLFIAKPDYLEVILTSIQHITKSSAYDRFSPWLGRGLLTSTGSKWQLHRKLITPTFHFKILEDFFEVFLEKSNVLVTKMKELPSNKVIDLMPLISRCTLDIICETAMGTQLKIQEDKEHDLYVHTVNELSELITYREFRPWLYPEIIFYNTGKGKQFLQCLSILHGFTEKVIQERKQQKLNDGDSSNKPKQNELPEGSKRRLALLDLLLETQGSSGQMTDLEIREEVDTFMFEGHDTTAMAITWTLYLLGRHSHIQDAVVEEIERVFSVFDHLNMEALTELKYLERVIKEALRLYPSVPFIARRIEDDLPLDDKYTIPAGTNVTIDIYHTHRDPEQFPDPDTFNPENFLPEKTRQRHPFAYVPFSAGPRNCIGQKFALMEEKTMLSHIIRHFQIEAVEEKPLMLQEMTLKPVNGLLVKLTPRKHV